MSLGLKGLRSQVEVPQVGKNKKKGEERNIED